MTKIIWAVLALALINGLARGDELPQRKAGLWEIVSTDPDQNVASLFTNIEIPTQAAVSMALGTVQFDRH